MHDFFQAQGLLALLTLTLLEIVLGVDNIIFISILSGKLPQALREKARLTGLGLAMITRILLLFSITLLMSLTQPILTIAGNEISGKDLILLAGGLFLLAKSTREIHEKLESAEEHGTEPKKKLTFASVVFQILMLDIVFSLDSVITAVGMTNQLPVMIAAVVISVVFMMFFSGKISDFINDHPTIKMLALGFLLMIGMMLILEGFDQHVPRGYIYFAMAFSLFIEFLNMRTRKKAVSPVRLRSSRPGK